MNSWKLSAGRCTNEKLDLQTALDAKMADQGFTAWEKHNLHEAVFHSL